MYIAYIPFPPYLSQITSVFDVPGVDVSALYGAIIRPYGDGHRRAIQYRITICAIQDILPNTGSLNYIIFEARLLVRAM